MRILISNDDGVHAKGINVLENIAKTISDDVWVVAPDVDQSGASHALTLRSPFRITQHQEKKFSISGTPSDCIMAAVSMLLKDKKPDLVLSGINNGCNLAEDVIYSGTVAAAIEGSLMKIPAIAMSLTIENKRPPQWEMIEHFGKDIIRKLFALGYRDKLVYNINFPNISKEDVKGIKITSQGQRIIGDQIVQCVDPRGVPYYWIGAAEYRSSDIWQHVTPDTDLEAIAQKCISITPLSFDLSDVTAKDILKEVFSS